MLQLELPSRHEVEAQIVTATQARMRYGYSVPAVVVLSGLGSPKPRLGFFFEVGRKAGELSAYQEGALFLVLAVIH